MYSQSKYHENSYVKNVTLIVVNVSRGGFSRILLEDSIGSKRINNN